jgi:excisionase family DNA binding protein
MKNEGENRHHEPNIIGVKPMNEILTADEAAEMFRVSTPYIRGMANSGEIPGTKMGDDWRFVRQDLIDHLRERSRREQQARKFQQEQRQQQPQTIMPGKRGRPRKHDVVEYLHPNPAD